jgi:hypothetical protein
LIAERHVDHAAGHQKDKHGFGDNLAKKAQGTSLPSDRQYIGAISRQLRQCFAFA